MEMEIGSCSCSGFMAGRLASRRNELRLVVVPACRRHLINDNDWGLGLGFAWAWAWLGLRVNVGVTCALLLTRGNPFLDAAMGCKWLMIHRREQYLESVFLF
jgi:hypothetical protein